MKIDCVNIEIHRIKRPVRRGKDRGVEREGKEEGGGRETREAILFWAKRWTE